MLRPRVVRAVALTLLLAGTASPLALAAGPRPSRPASVSQSILGEMWSTVRSLLVSFGLSPDSGQGMDPDGRQSATPDAGQEMDPDG